MRKFTQMLSRLYHTNTRLLRYLGLPILALILTHLVSYRKLPFDSDYQFPGMVFAFVFVICAICCETNFICYQSIKKRQALKGNNRPGIFNQLLISGLLTAAVFAFLVYSINYFVFGVVTPVTRFLSSLLIAELIILLETLYFITRDLYLANANIENTRSSEPWRITSGRKILMVEPSTIAYLYSQAGLVYLVTNEGQKILTQFTSFNELRENQQLDDFFQINRQYLVKLHAIDTVMKEVNQKLKIKLSPSAPEIPEAAMISRYRSGDFKKWLAK